MILERHTKKILAEIALLASGSHFVGEADDIIHALKKMDIDKEAITVIQAYRLMNDNKYIESTKILYDYCNGEEPGLADFLLGLSFKKLGFGKQVDAVIDKLSLSEDQNLKVLADELRE